MATVIRRTVASTPHRTAGETWDVVMSILAPDATSPARAELKKVAGVACSSIASEGALNDAIIVHGHGPQIRIYCVFGDDAILGEGVDESPLKESPTEGDWKMSIPVPKEDLEWSQRKLKSDSTRVSARSLGESLEDENEKSAAVVAAISINVSEFLKP
jgi:hypothetical protein